MIQFFVIYFRTTRPALLYVGSVSVLAVYSILYGFTAKEACWLGGVTSTSVFIFGKNFQLICLISLSNFSKLGQQLPLCLVCDSGTSDANIGACLFGFELLRSRVLALFLAGVYRVFLICFGVHYWYATLYSKN